ncbi:hypothetical protein RFZ01_07225, partial [Acinetobacter pittii]
LFNASKQPCLNLMATMSWNSDFHPILGIEPFIVLGTMSSDKASRFSQLIVQLIVFHCCN